MDENPAEAADRAEILKLRRRLYLQEGELQEARCTLERKKEELGNARGAHDELCLEHGHLETADRRTSADLREEKRKSDELTKQLKAMAQNLSGILGTEGAAAGTGNLQASSLKKRCDKLVQQNTALDVQSRLLQRQKGWAEAKARVFQNEVTKVYLGIHDRVKDSPELEVATERAFAAGSSRWDEANICTLHAPLNYEHREAVVDFLTHITHTKGKGVHSFLQSSRVFSEAIRHECLSGLGREFYALWRMNQQHPRVIRAAERLIHLRDYHAAFESFPTEIVALFGCAQAKLWTVDNSRRTISTCLRDGSMHTVAIPCGRSERDLAGLGIMVAACVTQKVIHLEDFATDPCYCEATDSGPDRKATNILCVPIFTPDRNQVRVVLQAVNKQQPFDEDTDARVLRILGRVSMEVIQVCETSDAHAATNRRKESLLTLLNEHAPIDGDVGLMTYLEQGLQRLFKCQTSVLHLVTGTEGQVGATQGQHFSQQGTVRLQVDPQQRTDAAASVQRTKIDGGLRGLAGHSIRSMSQVAWLSSQLGDIGSPYDPAVDLYAPGGTIVHTIPINSAGNGCVGVCQFVCPERDRSSAMVDDGTYHPENRSHYRLLMVLLNFVQRHLEFFDQDSMPVGSRGNSFADSKASDCADRSTSKRQESKEFHAEKGEKVVRVTTEEQAAQVVAELSANVVVNEDEPQEKEKATPAKSLFDVAAKLKA